MTASMADLPSDLPDVSQAALNNGVFRGGSGQLGHQAQSMLATLARTVGPKFGEVVEVLQLNKATRLSGLLAHVTGLDRTVVHRHLQHLQGADAKIKVPMNKGGRKRKHVECLEPADDLPLELPSLSSTPVSFLVPPEEDLPLQQPVDFAHPMSIPLEAGPAILCGADEDSGMQLAIVF